MLDFSITHVGVYRSPEKHVQTVHCPWISFYVSGLKHCRTYLPDGRLIREDGPRTGPYLAIKLPGMKVDFEHGSKRENWIIMLRDFPVRYPDAMDCVEMDLGSWTSIPFFTELPKERVAGWQAEFKRLQTLLEEPTPLNIVKARLGVMGVLRFMIERKAESIGESPEERLKQMIDRDSSFKSNISELGRGCGMSPDHLRILFQRRYRISPQAYRQQRRNAHIMEMIANSQLSIKEISCCAGFKHMSHFCAEFKRQFGMTPKDGVRHFRYLRP